MSFTWHFTGASATPVTQAVALSDGKAVFVMRAAAVQLGLYAVRAADFPEPAEAAKTACGAETRRGPDPRVDRLRRATVEGEGLPDSALGSLQVEGGEEVFPLSRSGGGRDRENQQENKADAHPATTAPGRHKRVITSDSVLGSDPNLHFHTPATAAAAGRAARSCARAAR